MYAGGFFIGQIRKNQGWLLSLSAGILAAVLLAIFRVEIMDTVGRQQLHGAQLMTNWQASGQFFGYLLLIRGVPFYLLVLLTLRIGRRRFFYCYFAYCGFVYGVQAILMTMQYRLAALPLLAAQLMPQILLYIPALYLGYGIVSAGYGRGAAGKRAASGAFLWTLGLAAEWYVNPLILQFCMRYFL